jgi:hypothetical protein
VFTFLLWAVIIGTGIGFIVGLVKEKKDPGAWFGYGAVVAVFGSVLSVFALLIVGLMAQPIEAGEKRVKEVTTYTVADKSDMEVNGSSLEFTYVDEHDTLQHYDGWADEIDFQGDKRKTVEITEFQWIKSNILPWDIISDGRSAVIK